MEKTLTVYMSGVEAANLDELKADSSLHFSLEFTPNKLEKSDSKEKKFSKIKDNIYSVIAEVIDVSGNIVVLDFGFQVVGFIQPFQDVDLNKGDFINSELELTYLSEDLKGKNIYYDWKVLKIVEIIEEEITYHEEDGQYKRKLQKMEQSVKEVNNPHLSEYPEVYEYRIDVEKV